MNLSHSSKHRLYRICLFGWNGLQIAAPKILKVSSRDTENNHSIV